MSSATASNLVEAEWWSQEGNECADTLGVVFGIVREENEWRTDADEYHWGLYEGTGLGGVKLQSRRNLTYSGATLPDNICKMAVNTLTAKVATIRPIPQVFAMRGNWKDHRRARKMRQFVDGAFYQHKVHEELASRIIKDALIARAGVVQVYADGKKTKVERIHSWTLFVDDWDAEFGEPLSLMRLRTMDRAKAIRTLGKTEELRDKIKEAGRFSTATGLALDEARSATVERVELLEAWHRCPDHDDDDEDHECVGKHIIICEGAVLFSEPWPHKEFPFAILAYDTPNTGYWGTPLVQDLEGYQVSTNDANERLAEQYKHSGKGVILRDGSGIPTSHVVNGLFVWQAKGSHLDPTVFDLDLVNEHMRMRPPELIERGLNAAGISQMAAQSQKPAGIESGIALQTLDDVESQRHIVFGRRFEAWCMNVARLLIDAVKKIAKKYGEYEVEVPMRGAYLPLKWSDVEIDGFQLQLQSVGQLFTSFAGRLEKLKTLFEMNAIDRGTFMRHLDAGDVQSEIDLETVDKLLVDEMLEAMLDLDAPANDNDPGVPSGYLAPHKYLPLEWAQRRAHQKRLQSEMEGAPPFVLSLLGRFIDDCDYLLAKKKLGDAAPAPPPTAGPSPIAPPPDGGQPMPAPPMGADPMGPPPDAAMSPPIAA